MRLARLITAIATLMLAPLAHAQGVKLTPAEGDYIAKDFAFRSCGCITRRWARRTAMPRARSTMRC